MIGNYNEITEGTTTGKPAYILYCRNGGCIVEINSAIADYFNITWTYSSILIPAFSIWDKKLTFDTIEQQINGIFSESAKQALLAANIRGVTVRVYFHDDEAENRSMVGREWLRLFDCLTEKKQRKIEKILFS